MKKLFKLFMTILILIVSVNFVIKYIYKTEYIDIIKSECQNYDIDPIEVLSIIKAESDFKPDAVSEKGAIGLMQLTPDTANWCAEKLGMSKLSESDLYVPKTNIKIGVYYYNYLLQRYDDLNTAISAYNAGMGNVDKWLKDKEYSKDGITINTTPYPETTRYITKINNNIKIYKLLYKELY